MNLTKDNIRKNPGLKKLQRFINYCSEAGLLTRQELVSMLPPIFLDIQPTDMILDMCAAPGSKTSQMLEIILSTSSEKKMINMTGGVVANDADPKRAFMLTHQLQRINTTGMLVINHEGQHIPTIRRDVGVNQDPKYYFDKVLADVPCSGDGAIRKLPTKWRGWSAKDGYSLHPVQIQLLERSLQLVKEGGLVLYSTCSLNPIENEAVVSEVLERANRENPGSLELLDIHDKYPGLVGRRGLAEWFVAVEKAEMKQHKAADSADFKFEDLFDTIERLDEQTAEKHGYIRGALFSRRVHVSPLCAAPARRAENPLHYARHARRHEHRRLLPRAAQKEQAHHVQKKPR